MVGPVEVSSEIYEIPYGAVILQDLHGIWTQLFGQTCCPQTVIAHRQVCFESLSNVPQHLHTSISKKKQSIILHAAQRTTTKAGNFMWNTITAMLPAGSAGNAPGWTLPSAQSPGRRSQRPLRQVLTAEPSQALCLNMSPAHGGLHLEAEVLAAGEAAGEAAREAPGEAGAVEACLPGAQLHVVAAVIRRTLLRLGQHLP